jgi:hypothetical protein
VFKTLAGETHLLLRSEGGSWTTGVPDFATDVVAETTGLDDAALLRAIEECRGQA